MMPRWSTLAGKLVVLPFSGVSGLNFPIADKPTGATSACMPFARHPLLLVHLRGSVVIPCHKRCYMGPVASIAHDRITSKLGEGGMAEVYRATGTKLNREVATRVFPQSFAQDLDRITRFTREAQLLASLNRANIAAIHIPRGQVLFVDGSEFKSRDKTATRLLGGW